jgi:hypothetical protein
MSEEEKSDDYRYGEPASESKKSEIESVGARAKSAHPGRKAKLEPREVSVHDMTSDQEAYRLRPSTAIRVQ